MAKHEWKIRKSLNKYNKALNANLVKDRINMFKKYLAEKKHKALRLGFSGHP